MSVDHLSADDVEIARQCLHAAVDGPFFPEWEFQTLMGLTWQEVAAVAAAWPRAADEDSQEAVINNVLNNLLGYPHGERDEWGNFINVPEAEVAEVLTRWRGDDEFDPSGRGCADRLR